MSARRPHVFTIDPGAHFLSSFARALITGEVIEGFRPLDDPLALADATIYVPTRRASRALAAELQQCLPGRAAILPRIVPLGHMDNIEAGLLLDDVSSDDFALDAPPAITPMGRRAVLTRLILNWSQTLCRAIISVDENGKPVTHPDEALLVANSPPQAWRLAGELARLIDEMIIEGVPWEALKPLTPEADYDKYWGITLDFLKIAGNVWPDYLVNVRMTDAAARQAQLVEAEVRRLERQDESAPPVIAIGSTGTNKATAHLLAAIARAPRGAVVLPGLDQHLDAESWAQIAGDALGRNAVASHPQAALRKLLPVLGVAREDVGKLGGGEKVLKWRNIFLSEAMRPAETTDRWRMLGDALSKEKIESALADVALVEAADQREEALGLAVAIRAALEDQDKTIALATPDRALAQRVRAELARWNIEVDDSGGESLGVTSVGALARLLIACADIEASDSCLLALLNHPLASFGGDDANTQLNRALLECAVLRQPARGAELASRIAAARELQEDRHAHPLLRRVSEEDWVGLQTYVTAVQDALSPLRNVPRDASLAVWIDAHRAAIAGVMRDDSTGRAEADARDALDTLFDELAAHADVLPEPLKAAEYAAFFDQLTSETIVRGPRRAHPRVKILGLLEARLLDADLMILGGLDENVWPPQASGDPFLNRPMREQIGLSSPERRLGQTAHDFVQLMGARRVLLSRSAKRDGAPTVPSRFLQRIKAIAGDAVWNDCLARGARWLHLAQAVDHEANPPPPLRAPEPRPSVDLRPVSLSVTRIETLRRDPYSIYAERILDLIPLQDLDADFGPRERGEKLHDLVAKFTVAYPEAALPPGALAQLLRNARQSFAPELEDAEFRTFLWPRIEATLAEYVEWEQARRENTRQIIVEKPARLDISLADGSNFRLTARADRIEILQDGSVALIDFKSGNPPSPTEVDVGFAPQLTLEAAMTRRGAFAEIPVDSTVSDARYVKLLGKNEIKQTQVGKKAGIAVLAEDHFKGLIELLNEFRSPDRSYPSRPYVKFISRYGEYDHLARVKEWSSSGREGAE